MYDPKTGAFYFGDTESGRIGLLQRESAYYIKFNSAKAMYAFKKLKSEFCGTTEEKCFYYHVYLDLLFEATGLVSSRFIRKNNVNANVKQMIEYNRQQYEFDESNYPLLNNRFFRNFIEHIDEKDEKLVEKEGFFGTFNLIFPGMDEETRKELLRKDKPQNNLLNIEDMTYTILRVQNNALMPNRICLNQLENELRQINIIAESIWSHLSSPL